MRDRELDASGVTSLVTIQREEGGLEMGRLFVRASDNVVYFKSLLDIEADKKSRGRSQEKPGDTFNAGLGPYT